MDYFNLLRILENKIQNRPPPLKFSIQEIENPELAQERMKQLYEQKGYPQDWIDKRLRGII